MAYLSFHDCLAAFLCALTAESVVLHARLNAVRDYERLLDADRNDEMTGLYNRRYFIRRGEEIVKDGSQAGRYSAVYYNFSGLRTFNRDYGFTEGDDLLRFFSDCLKEVYPQCISARFGEDHFAVLIREEDPHEKSAELIQQVNQYLQAKYGRHLNETSSDAGSDDTMLLALRAGVSEIHSGLSVEDACDRARAACYSVRAEDRGCCRSYDAALEETYANEQYVLRHVDEAIRRHDIKVFYQPVVRAMTEQLCGEEALARWNDPEKGMLRPDQFIPVLEKHMQLYKVDLYMCEQVLRDFDTKKMKALEIVPVSINLSRNDFAGHDMVKSISDLMDRYHCPHHLIDIEITESAYVDDPKEIDSVIERFHEAGFHVWMDDFGSGYSSLNMLQDSHFNLIKLDMRFMHNFSRKNELITGTIISMAGRLQGYYYSRPIPLDEVIRRAETAEHLSVEKESQSAYLDAISRLDLSNPFGSFHDRVTESLRDSLPCIISS